MNPRRAYGLVWPLDVLPAHSCDAFVNLGPTFGEVERKMIAIAGMTLREIVRALPDMEVTFA